MTQKLTISILAALILTAACASPVVAGELARAWEQPTVAPDASVAAGSAPIEQALSTIIPAPYRIALDQSVPATAVVVWPAGNDWMKVLRAAMAPLDLYVEPDWKDNVIRIVRISAIRGQSQGVTDRMPATPGATMPAAAADAGKFQPWPQLDPKAIPTTERVAGDPPAGQGSTKATPYYDNDKATTTTKFSVAAAAPQAPASPESTGYTIPKGIMLSEGIERYVKRFGWTSKYRVDDYLIDEPLPIPAGSMTDGITFLIRTYQKQGGLLGVAPEFAKPNKVVSIRPAEVEEN